MSRQAKKKPVEEIDLDDLNVELREMHRVFLRCLTNEVKQRRHAPPPVPILLRLRSESFLPSNYYVGFQTSVWTDLISDTPRGRYKGLACMVMESVSRGDRWRVYEPYYHQSGGRTQSDRREEGEYLVCFEAIGKIRTLMEGEVFREIPYNRTFYMQDIAKAFAVVDDRDALQDSALHRAAYYDLGPLAAYLLHRGEQIDGRNAGGETPLHIAVASGSLEVLKLLIKNGAQLDLYDGRGDTPLTSALYRSGVDPALLLLAAGANPNLQSQHSDPPALIRAVEERIMGYEDGTVTSGSVTRPSGWLTKIKTVKSLLDHGVAINVKNRNGLNAMELAQASGDQELVAVLAPYWASF